jgi:uncharacterized protein (DUF362 family)
VLTIKTVARYERTTLIELFDALLEDTGIFSGARARGKRVLLKPNFVMPEKREDPSTTHPDFYMALAQSFMKAGFVVGIGESPAFGSCADALRAHDVLEECAALGIEVVEFKAPRQVEGVDGARSYRTLSVAAELSEWDSVVNVPKVKTHRQFVFTGATKNLYGCVVGKRKFIRHNLCGNDPVRFAQMILANARAIDCVAHIGDGITAMHVLGPRGGEPYALNAVIVADDPLVHDVAQCYLIGLDPADTPLFQALSDEQMSAVNQAAAARLRESGLEPADDFVHAPLIHISFSPWAVARSGLRTLRYKLAQS